MAEGDKPWGGEKKNTGPGESVGMGLLSLESEGLQEALRRK